MLTPLSLPHSFRAFGPLRYARITLDPATGRSRGTGFACFWDRAHADAAVELSALLRADAGPALGAVRDPICTRAAR
jgi:hypothetical protein